jgi:hypothetical protein
MDYLQKAKEYADMVAIDRNGRYEFTFDQTNLEYFLDSIGVDWTKLQGENNVQNG